MQHPEIRLDTDRLPAGPWIYARHVPEQEAPPDGSLVAVIDRSGRFVAHAFYNGASDVRLRVLSRGRRKALDRPKEFLLRRLAAAARLRRRVLRLEEVTDAWRLAHAEGDDLPGLIVDRLGPVTVCEYHALGFWKLKREIEWALGELDATTRVVHRLPPGPARAEGMRIEEEEPTEEVGTVEIREHGLLFPVTPGRGHKTGWFCDQRDNRQRIARLAAGRDVLDLCTNAGGFALNAARAGARRVRAVDLDEVALARARRAAAANALEVDVLHADAFNVLRQVKGEGRKPDLVVLDPHKLIPSKARFEDGRKKYSDLNTLALEAVAPEGLIATFSCSGALDLAGFLGILFQASRRAGRRVRLLEVMGAAPDHPQRPEFARSRYLKGALLAVDG